MSLKKQAGIKVLEGVKKYTGAALRGLGLSGKKSVTNLQHPVLDKLKIKKSSFIFDLNNVLTAKQTFKIKNKKLTFFSLGRDIIKN